MIKFYLVFVSLFCLLFSPFAVKAEDSGAIYTRLLDGDVLVKNQDSTEWLPASINMPLWNGDSLWTPQDSKAELMLRNGSVIRISETSYLEVFSSNDTNPGFRLTSGRLYGNVKPYDGSPLLFETPATSISVYQASVFMIDLSVNGDASISVLQGEVLVDVAGGQVKASAGQRIYLRSNERYPEFYRLASADRWEAWNKKRDEEIFRRYNDDSRYLPEELSAYSGDFSRNGRWVYEADYGYVWTPTIIISNDWSPYRVGRWVWIHGDYVWISYEPWGWAPYHYGRWAFLQHRGWCWVPPGRGAVHWAPGYVAWVHTPQYVAWVPLAPHEPYFGRGRYANIDRDRRHHGNEGNIVFKNMNIKNAVMMTQRDNFLQGKPAAFITPKENPFVRERRIMPPPDIKPEKMALMPVIKEIPRVKLPPQKIESEVLKHRKTNPVFGQQPIQKMPSTDMPRKVDLPPMNGKDHQDGKEVINVHPIGNGHDKAVEFDKRDGVKIHEPPKPLTSPAQPLATRPNITTRELTPPQKTITTPVLPNAGNLNRDHWDKPEKPAVIHTPPGQPPVFKQPKVDEKVTTRPIERSITSPGTFNTPKTDAVKKPEGFIQPPPPQWGPKGIQPPNAGINNKTITKENPTIHKNQNIQQGQWGKPANINTGKQTDEHRSGDIPASGEPKERKGQ